MITFVFSAFWHGYYASYYLTFILLFFLMNGNGILIKIGFYDYIRKNRFLTVLVSVWTAIVFSSIGIYFYNLEWYKVIGVTINLKYFNFIVIAFYNSLRFFIKVPKEIKNKDKEKSDEKKKIN